MEAAKKCNVSECENPCVARGLCARHYKRWQRHGDVDHARPSDWGRRRAHPLYSIWRTLFRNANGGGRMVCERWHDLWAFVEDVGERPDVDHDLGRKNSRAPYSKENCYWREKRIKWSEGSVSQQKIDYHRNYHAVNRDKVLDRQFRRFYGITLPTYLAMHAAQGGLCAICGRPETKVDPRTGNPRRLAVDHCHKTEKVRQLLCWPCNSALGSFQDDIPRLESAIAYLKRHVPPTT